MIHMPIIQYIRPMQLITKTKRSLLWTMHGHHSGLLVLLPAWNCKKWLSAKEATQSWQTTFKVGGQPSALAWVTPEQNVQYTLIDLVLCRQKQLQSYISALTLNVCTSIQPKAQTNGSSQKIWDSYIQQYANFLKTFLLTYIEPFLGKYLE